MRCLGVLGCHLHTLIASIMEHEAGVLKHGQQEQQEGNARQGWERNGNDCATPNSCCLAHISCVAWGTVLTLRRLITAPTHAHELRASHGTEVEAEHHPEARLSLLHTICEGPVRLVSEQSGRSRMRLTDALI